MYSCFKVIAAKINIENKNHNGESQKEFIFSKCFSHHVCDGRSCSMSACSKCYCKIAANSTSSFLLAALTSGVSSLCSLHVLILKLCSILASLLRRIENNSRPLAIFRAFQPNDQLTTSLLGHNGLPQALFVASLNR